METKRKKDNKEIKIKKVIADHLENSKEVHNFLAACGTQLPVTQDVISDLEQFVIQYIYCDAKINTLGEVRVYKK